MERVNQRTNHLLGSNIKRLREEKGLRNRDIVAQLQLRGIEISYRNVFKSGIRVKQSKCGFADCINGYIGV